MAKDQNPKFAGCEAIISCAKEEASRLNHSWINTGHFLLGLVHKSEVARRILYELGVDLIKLENEIKAIVCKKPVTSTDKTLFLGFTHATIQVLQYAREEAQKVRSDYVYGEHVLIGLLQKRESTAYKVLYNFGITLEKVRELIDPRPVLKLSTGQLNLNHIDKPIRNLIYLLNKIPFLETSCSCSGHPDMPEREWKDGVITMTPIVDFKQTMEFLERIRALLDNTCRLKSFHNKNTFYFNRTLTLYQQVEGEALYHSSIPILTTRCCLLINLPLHPVNLHLLWNIAPRVAQKFILSSQKLSSTSIYMSRTKIREPQGDAELFINLLRSVSHIREIKIKNFSERIAIHGSLDPHLMSQIIIEFLWDSISIQWGWDFMNYLKIHFNKEVDLLDIQNKPQYHLIFSIMPIVRRSNLKRTREDHIKIWKLIELAVEKLLHEETVVKDIRC
ncbi:MAG: Clp protease N-terminal domain-containing protein [Promethearchaeota archaeon]